MRVSLRARLLAEPITRDLCSLPEEGAPTLLCPIRRVVNVNRGPAATHPAPRLIEQHSRCAIARRQAVAIDVDLVGSGERIPGLRPEVGELAAANRLEEGRINHHRPVPVSLEK